MSSDAVGQVFVLIPTHNRKDILAKTLAAVSKQLPVGSARLVIVDAGSTDGTQAIVRAMVPSAEIVSGNADMWWTATVIHGLKYIAQSARAGDRVLLMNDDVDFAPDALVRLLESAALKPRAVIGAINITQRPGEEPRVFFCGGRYDLRFARHKVPMRPGTLWREPAERLLESDFLYGRLMLIPWQVIQSGCYFDCITFPQYCADEDFTFSAKKRGFEVLVDAKSVVFVNEATTSQLSLNLRKSGLAGILKALTAFNSVYNLKQGWAFARRHARWPLTFMLCRYGITFVGENRRLGRKRAP